MLPLPTPPQGMFNWQMTYTPNTGKLLKDFTGRKQGTKLNWIQSKSEVKGQFTKKWHSLLPPEETFNCWMAHNENIEKRLRIFIDTKQRTKLNWNQSKFRIPNSGIPWWLRRERLISGWTTPKIVGNSYGIFRNEASNSAYFNALWIRNQVLAYPDACGYSWGNG